MAKTPPEYDSGTISPELNPSRRRVASTSPMSSVAAAVRIASRSSHRNGQLADGRRKCGDLLPRALPPMQHEPDEIDVRVQFHGAAEHVVQRAALGSAIAHLRECAQRSDAIQSARPLVAEKLSPAADANTDSGSPAVVIERCRR